MTIKVPIIGHCLFVYVVLLDTETLKPTMSKTASITENLGVRLIGFVSLEVVRVMTNVAREMMHIRTSG
ncbi:hypothetical protein [Roseobacter sp.]|uniref:hypothetical protein n=1 Tax=Roseobacter sp. TaxID=1907202 RepID=UPI00385F9945